MTLETETLEGVLAQVQAQADKAIFDYRAECGRRGDGEWAEQLATALAQILTTARTRNG
jgi:hypothetical protein